MPQEFLASFAVEIDEAGVSRLERILENNRELARKLADAFDEAHGAMEGLIRPLTEDMEGILPFPRPEAAAETPGTAGNFPVGLDFAEAGKQLETFLAGAKKQLRLSADGSGIVSAVSAAISRARSMLAGAGLTLPVQVETRGAAEIGCHVETTDGIALPVASSQSTRYSMRTTPCVLFTTFACIVKWLDDPFARRTSVTHTAVPRLGATVTRRSIGGV